MATEIRELLSQKFFPLPLQSFGLLRSAHHGCVSVGDELAAEGESEFEKSRSVWECVGQVSREHCWLRLDGKRKDKNWRAYELCEVPQCFAFTSSGGMSTFKCL